MIRKILVAEDDPVARTVLRAALQQEGYETFVAADGREGRELFDRLQPDLLITDLDMPDVDGFALIAHVVNTRASVPVVIVSGVERDRVLERMTTRFRIAHLAKPIDLERLRITVSHYAHSTGSMQGVTLFGFLQMLSQEGKSCALRIESGTKEGLFCLEDGNVVDAYSPGLQGTPAAFEILSWPAPKIEVRAPRELNSRSIAMSTIELLLEAARAMDEEDAPDGTAGSEDDDAERLGLESPVEQQSRAADLLSVGEYLAAAMQIEGARAAAALDGRTLQPLAVVRLDSRLLGRMQDLVRSSFRAAAEEGEGPVESAVLTHADTHWVIRRRQAPDVFLLLILDRSVADLQHATSRLAELESVIHD